MWLKFDLTHGEIDRLCRRAGRPDKVRKLREYYDNIRKQIFSKLDWMTRKFLEHPSHDDAESGWLRQLEFASSIDTVPPVYPFPPSDSQLSIAAIPNMEWIHRAWMNIDILEANAWTVRDSALLLLASTRTATYIKYRAAELKDPARDASMSGIDGKTRVYASERF
jgi:hypothetical protein